MLLPFRVSPITSDITILVIEDDSAVRRGVVDVLECAGYRAAELLEPMRERFESRLTTAGMTLEMDLSGEASSAPMKVDAAAVEHILFNLVDNAAKYASGGQPPILSIHVVRNGQRIEIHATDHGPGIVTGERGRIFHAFHQSAHEAAESKPGVGLGLALSRRLAKSLGGDLTCMSSDQGGAHFVLSLPRTQA